MRKDIVRASREYHEKARSFFTFKNVIRPMRIKTNFGRGISGRGDKQVSKELDIYDY